MAESNDTASFPLLGFVLPVGAVGASIALAATQTGQWWLFPVLVVVGAAGPFIDLMRRQASVDALGDEIASLQRAAKTRLDRLGGATADYDKQLSGTLNDVETLSRFFKDQVGAVDKTTATLGKTTKALKEISDSVEALATAAEESSASILEMSAANDEIAENMVTLATSVSESASSIEEMTYSTKEVANNVLELSSTAEETSSSMNEMDMSIHQVQNNANETAKLSEEVARAASAGVEAIHQTTEAIHKIRDSSGEAKNVIDQLGAKIGEIDKILQVIDDVAEQTNLLALNAAIIAAQAGEHGKGFAVVADEIKDLAERAGASTKEIAELIKTVQAESKNAVTAVEQGTLSVDDGVRVSHEAEDALRRILDSAEKSRAMVRDIARATVEQARGSKQVTDAINRIAETVQSIATATTEQSKGSEAIMRSAEKMRVITKHVERSSQEQNRGSKQITRTIEAIADQVHQLSGAHREQSKAAALLLDALEDVRSALHGKAEDVESLRTELGQLEVSASRLKAAARDLGA